MIISDIDDWKSDAFCIGAGHQFLSYTGETTKARLVREEVCREICKRCPVMMDCRKSARANHEFGFWGGESEEERGDAGYFPSGCNRHLLLD